MEWEDGRFSALAASSNMTVSKSGVGWIATFATLYIRYIVIVDR
jgi:hypothetical protein